MKLFAGSFLATALFRLFEGLFDLEYAAWRMYRWLGSLIQYDDALIVALSAEFTIALIPIVWIYGFGNRYARWLVWGFGSLQLLSFRGLYVVTSNLGFVHFSAYIEPALILLAMAALLLPGSKRWFKMGASNDAEIFE